MGATTFSSAVRVSNGETAEQAFRKAVQDAQYEHGHGGYTGTIAEKNSFVVITKSRGWKAAHQLANPDDPICEDKYGPAACIEVLNDAGRKRIGYLFFGWAAE